MTQAAAKRTVAVRALGGTVAMRSSGSGAVPIVDAADLVASLPGIADLATINTESLSLVPGASLRIADLLEVVPRLEACVAAGASGIVVTTGTDTLEEVAYLFDLLWRHPEPLVVTGAMRAADVPGTDGPANVRAAITTAASDGVRGQGCLVVLNDEIHRARSVRKLHTTSPAAFVSDRSAAVGYVHEGGVWLERAVARPPALSLTQPVGPIPRVALLRLGLDPGVDLLEHAVSTHECVVVETFGAGHVPAWWVEPLRQAAEKVPIIVTSRTGAGRMFRGSYGFRGSERDLVAAELIFADDLDGLKARILATVALLTGGQQDLADIVRSQTDRREMPPRQRALS